MMHEDILKRITVARGEIGEGNVRSEMRMIVWGNRLCIGTLGLGLVLVATIIIRWVAQ